MSLILRKFALHNAKHNLLRSSDQHILPIANRKLSIVPSLYDGDKDPGPKFFSSNVQLLLKRLTRPDFNRIFRKRTNKGYTVLKTPSYKFLTNEELEIEIKKANVKADRLLQMPPVIKVHEPVNDIISEDPALSGYDSSKYLFTDITFGVSNEHRIIVERDVDGTLRSCDHDTRKKLNQIYFPINGRKIKEPLMFTEEELLHSLLEREKYEFVLDRACIQYEPDEPKYQKVTSITYQHVDAEMKFEILRSTRHFGPMAFYLTWHQSMDNLMLELLQGGFLREGVLLVALRQALLGDVTNGEASYPIAHEIFSTPILLSKPESLTEDDIKLDTKCLECIEKYITSNSSMKSQQELALQGFREYYQQLVQLSRGLKKAHGNA